MCIELLTAGLWHDSLGDKALELATLRGMARRGLCLVPVAKASGRHPCIVGGGHLIQCRPKAGDRWSRILSVFRVEGEHALNAVGLAFNGCDRLASLRYLKRYRYVSVRDCDSRDVLQSAGIEDVRVVPCPAVLLDPMEWDYVKVLPGFGFMNKLVDVPYIVVHRDPEVERILPELGWDGQVVVVDPQQWRHNGWRGAGIQVRTGSPEALLSVMSRSRFVLGRSLHLGIFSICVGVPFRLVGGGDNDPQSRKMAGYFARSGLQNAVIPPAEAGVIRHLDMAEERALLDAVRTRERTLANSHLDAMAASFMV